ncbi:type IV secretory system conjugative DNA transfer family protein [Brevundimonas naejangsanensis]|uniref:Type IV secretory system conjugative DNA transfer family protein n=1 Tax=Brevundimonas naejangsanensis TaxID=588932 RepID=A0A494RGL7_9CAUL|nr:type IV secretory system conjugative DNA transfer family protein [Brevundimonas naejangsanensis]AYG95627.1 type IV secretory system conjugative DNA transfer family protein [Brevundimonas naejangsanensis]
MTPLANASPAARAAAWTVTGLALAGVGAALALVIALAGTGHLAPDLDWLRIPAWIWRSRHDPELVRWLGAGAGASALLLAVMAAAVALNRRRPLHGAARWANGAEIARARLRAASGIVIGQARGRPLVFDGPEHVLLHAPTRTGKGVGVVIPNLLTWPGSVVVLDVKQENWTATAGYRARSGQTVWRFDPLDPRGRTARYNPLGHIDRRNPVETLDELQKIAVMLFPAPEHADPFWNEAARTGFIGVGAYVAETPELPFTLGEIFRQLTGGDPRRRLPALVEARAAAGRPLSAWCAAALLDFATAGENTFASIKQTITARMGLWLNPRVDAATAASDFDLRTLRRQPSSIYLGVSPDNVARCAPLYSLFFQQMVDLNTRRLPDRSAEPLDVLILLDEFARLGHAGVLARAFAYVAGYGLRLLPVLQSPAQLRAIYGPDVAEEIMSNCAVEVAFAPKELKTARDLSERLGAYTYAALSRSRPALPASGRRSITLSDQKRPLMLPQELMQMNADALIVMKAGMPPILGRKLRFFSHPVLKRRLLPPPDVPSIPGPVAPPPVAAPPAPTPAVDEWSLEGIVRSLEKEGAPVPPPRGAGEALFAGWVDAAIDHAACPARPEGRD